MLKATSSLGATDLASSTHTNYHSAPSVTPCFEPTVRFLWFAEVLVYLAYICVARAGLRNSGLLQKAQLMCTITLACTYALHHVANMLSLRRPSFMLIDPKLQLEASKLS